MKSWCDLPFVSHLLRWLHEVMLWFSFIAQIAQPQTKTCYLIWAIYVCHIVSLCECALSCCVLSHTSWDSMKSCCVLQLSCTDRDYSLKSCCVLYYFITNMLTTNKTCYQLNRLCMSHCKPLRRRTFLWCRTHHMTPWSHVVQFIDSGTNWALKGVVHNSAKQKKHICK